MLIHSVMIRKILTSMANGISEHRGEFSRRTLLQTSACGFGALAFQSLLAAERPGTGLSSPLSPHLPHHAPRAKRVIFLFMRGGPSQVDSFDYKPALEKRHGEDLGGGRRYFQCPWKFHPYGQSGLPVSGLFPHIARHADDLCVINSLHTDNGNHPQAILQMNTGSFQFIRPSMGSWITYGLGTENANLPGFITINPDFSAGGARNYDSAFLPAACGGTKIGTGDKADGKGPEPLAGASLPYTKHPALTAPQQRRQLDLVRSLNAERLDHQGSDGTLESILQSYELAFRMQRELPQLLDVDREDSATRTLYGLGNPVTENFGRACLMARRFVESGVRFVQLNHGFWDHHTDIFSGMANHAAETDQPIGALLTDLKRRGLLEDTLVLWGGEFGRPPILNKNNGRDHNPEGFTMWMAGGGVKAGLRYGATDETGQKAEQDKVHLHDLHATLLHALGLNHERLTYRYGGRDFRLTDIHGTVVRALLA